MAKIFGIDLGTTYSCIAYVNDYGKPEVVSNLESSPVTPSVVAFEDADSYSVGETAKNVLSTDPANVCSTIKRQMGKRDFTFMAFDKEYTPEAISALILKKLASDTADQLNDEVKNVVITCPAYFGMEERNATREAGKMAGLNVLDILNEPTAAAISYGLNVNEPQTVMVYDLGGGTFDVTIINVESGKIHVLATGGNHELGGKDWDEKVRDQIIADYCAATGEDAEGIRDNLELMGELELSSETAKKALTQREATTVRFNGERVEVTREQFDNMTKGLLDSTIDFTRDTIAKAQAKGMKDVDKILLVGGSTMMKQVKERLSQEFPDKPIEYCDPNQSVAKGAAIYGMNIAAFPTGEEGDPNQGDGNGPEPLDPTLVEEIKNNPIFVIGGGAPQKIEIVNVLSRSVAMEFVNGINNLVKRNTEIPCDVKLTAGTEVANQTSVRIRIFEDLLDDDIVPEDKCTLLAEQDLPLNSGLPAGSPVDIRVVIDKSGLLSIDVADASSNGKSTHIEIQLQNALSEKELKEQAEIIGSLKLN